MSKKKDFEQDFKRLRNALVHLDYGEVDKIMKAVQLDTAPSAKDYAAWRAAMILQANNELQRSSSAKEHLDLATIELVLTEYNLRGVVETDKVKLMKSDSNAALPSPKSAAVPPLNAEFILHIFLKRDELDAVVGDLYERYVKKYERFGPRRAKLWFYSEVLRSLWPLLKRFVAKAGGLLALGEWIRRHVS